METTTLRYHYHAGRQFQYPALHCQPGEVLLITGSSGCGKTTLLHLLSGLIRGGEGQIRIGQTDITRLADREMDRFRGRHIGIVFQQAHFLAALSVRENIAMALREKQQAPRIAYLAEQLSITHILDKAPSRISQGEMQRAAIARALVNQPSLLLADEPTSSLDDANAARVIALLQQLAMASQAALVVVTHDGRLKDSFKNHISLS